MFQEANENVIGEVEKFEFAKIKNFVFTKTTRYFFIFTIFLFIFLSASLGTIYIQLYFEQKELEKTEILGVQTRINSNNLYLKNFYDIANSSNFPNFDDYSARSIVVHDLNANKNIYEKNPEQKLGIASLSKLVTVKVLKDNFELNAITQITEESAKYEGSTISFKEGEIYTNRDIFKAALIASNNQGLYAIQDHKKTVDQMNKFAEKINLQNTRFSNPAGFDINGGNISTASDLVTISRIFFEDNELKDFAGIQKTEIKELRENRNITITNTNELLPNSNFPIIAGKTGTTPMAKQNLILLIEKNGQRYLIIILNSEDRYSDAIKILNRI
jgi:D-alanyl-D-alanine carboxypeptidase